MIFRSLIRRALLACCLVTLTGCIEYRFDYFGEQDRYLGWPTIRPDLDPKLGPKGKLFFTPPGYLNLYIGGRFAKRRLTANVGVIQYLSERSSLEFGYRNILFETDNEHFGDITGIVGWHDIDGEHMIYFGGTIKF